MNKVNASTKESKVLRIFWNHHTCQGVTNDRNGYPQVKFKREQKQTDFELKGSIDAAVKKAVREILDQYGERPQATRVTDNFAEIITHTVTTPQTTTEAKTKTISTEMCLFPPETWAATTSENPRKAKPKW